MEQSQNPQISSDPETKGFDLSAGKTWIYPENYPVREYQFNIVQTSLYSNTLVCLPTGLGKTFIAAVVMYNFWRWYPRGKVVFLAPTRPLVAQQIFACHDIMGIPSTETIELTGTVNQKQREIAWSKKRVVFATPQVFHNDLEKNIVPGDLVKCVVIDEAHKALGKHSYCECIRILSEKNQHFRVLALSATPGNKIDNVHEVLQNLHIAHVELKDETSLDIIPYINRRKIDIILVPLNDELTKYKERYVFIMDRHVKVLLKHNVLRSCHAANISKGRVFHLLKEFQKKNNKSGNHGQIMKTLNILMTMYHAYELMVRDGLRAFHKFFQNHSDKFWMSEETQLQNLLIDIQTFLGPFPDVTPLSKETIPDVPQNLVFGHTKFEKLKQLLLHHFKNSQENHGDTRAIVFVEYRDIVSEIYVLLLQCRPLIRPQMFVGQAGQRQRQQIKALENFRSNNVNVLISTSIGEEGLDVGEVDLIICFDVSQHSPTRLVQRMGRTGRKRDGHIIILVTDGREHETLKSTMARRDSLNNKILNTSNIFSSLYQKNSRMIPDIFTPQCFKMHINVQPKSPITKCRNKKTKSCKPDNTHKNSRKKIITTDINLESSKNRTKFSMTKFFKSETREKQTEDNSETLDIDMIQNNVCNTIKSTDVKILSCDNDAVDFLTLCALRDSEKEASIESENIVDQLVYVPKFSSPKNFFNFSIPDIKILDCLISLNDAIPIDCKSNNLDNNNDNANDSDDNANDSNDTYSDKYEFTNTKEADSKYVGGVSKFEDLLDDTSGSNESVALDVEEEINQSDNMHFVCEENADETKVKMENVNGSRELETSRFEDILNEISDDSASNAQVEDFKQIQKNNIVACNNPNFKASEPHLKIANQFEHSIQHYEQKNESNTRYSNLCKFKDQSMLSVTQAINEIARLNVRPNMPRTIDESEDDIFQDGSFHVQIDNEKGFERITEEEFNDETNFDESTRFNDANATIATEFNIEEYKWDDDFEILVDPVQDCVTLVTPNKKYEKLQEFAHKVEKRRLDNDDWISAEKSINTTKKNISNMSLAKKLAKIKDCWNSKDDCPTKRVEGENECGKSYFLNDANDDFYQSSDVRETTSRVTTNTVQKRNRIRKSRKAKNQFIDNEADVSTYDKGTTTEESSENDQDLEDFVSYTQNVYDTSDMHAHYLQTIKSPIKRHDGFLFKRSDTLDSDIEIYSQPQTQTHESYINDSFCVAEDEEEAIISSQIMELSELEKVEQELRRKKRKRFCVEKLNDSTKKKTKRTRRNVISYCTSSEDETEKLREQVKHESMLLAQSCQKS